MIDLDRLNRYADSHGPVTRARVADRDDRAHAGDHRAAQVVGRAGVFANYPLRVTEVRRDCGLAERDQAPRDSRQQLG